MSVNSFKPTIWNAALIANFHNKSVAATGALSAQPEEVTGDKIRFTALGAGKVKDYSKGTITWEELETSNVDMAFDQEKYFAFKISDVDKIQLKKDLLKDATAEHAAVMAELFDGHFYKVLADGAGNKIGTTAAKIKLNAQNVYDYIVQLGTELSKAKAPKADRFVSVPSEVVGLIARDPRFTRNYKVLENGIVEGGNINGMQLVVSEELPKNQIVAHWKKAIGTGSQIDKTEALRLQNDFADGVRGLQKYGAVVLKKEGIAVLNYTLDAPASTGA